MVTLTKTPAKIVTAEWHRLRRDVNGRHTHVIPGGLGYSRTGAVDRPHVELNGDPLIGYAVPVAALVGVNSHDDAVVVGGWHARRTLVHN